MGRAAGGVVVEVRNQFREHPGIMDYTEKPDYGRVVDICTRTSLQELLTSSENLASAKFQYFEAYSAALVYYLVIVSILMALQSRLERRFTWTSRRRPRISAPAVPAISHDAR